MLLVHGFQAGEIRAHVGSAPFNREGGETQNPYQDGRANCVTTNGQMASGKSRDFRPWESRPFPANSGSLLLPRIAQISILYPFE